MFHISSSVQSTVHSCQNKYTGAQLAELSLWPQYLSRNSGIHLESSANSNSISHHCIAVFAICHQHRRIFSRWIISLQCVLYIEANSANFYVVFIHLEITDHISPILHFILLLHNFSKIVDHACYMEKKLFHNKTWTLQVKDWGRLKSEDWEDDWTFDFDFFFS